MTRINSGTGATGPQSIPSQDSGSAQQVSKPDAKKTQQEPTAGEQQQGKQVAQGRKSDIDLQGTIKQSELAWFHGPGGSHENAKGRSNISAMDDDKSQKVRDIAQGAVIGAAIGGPAGVATGALIGSVPKSDEQIQMEKLYNDMMKMQQINGGTAGRPANKPDGSHADKAHGGMRMSPMEAENAKRAAEAEKAQKVKDAMEPIIAGAIVGGPAGAAIGSIEGAVPKLHGEQLIQQQMLDEAKQIQEFVDTRDPISGERIVDLEAQKDNINKTEEEK